MNFQNFGIRLTVIGMALSILGQGLYPAVDMYITGLNKSYYPYKILTRFFSEASTLPAEQEKARRCYSRVPVFSKPRFFVYYFSLFTTSQICYS